MVLTTLVRRSAACVSLAVAQALHTRCDRGVRFGVVADVQYCDIEDARNFAGTEIRFYRGSLDGARRAARGFEAARLGRGLDFVAQLGDLLDKMFTFEPEKRITVAQALAHPFITG